MAKEVPGKYPDSDKSLEDYIEKLDYNELKYGERYNIPTWRHLVEEKAENGENCRRYSYTSSTQQYSLSTCQGV